MNPRLPLLAAALCAACSCAASKRNTPGDDKAPGGPAATAPALIGRIASVPRAQGFVLIQSYGPWRSGIGTILTTRGPGQRSANLRVTGESLGQFAAADIQSGHVEVGDAVYSHHLPKIDDTTPAPGQEPGPPATLPAQPSGTSAEAPPAPDAAPTPEPGLPERETPAPPP